VSILIYPVRVQGDEARFDISNALKYLNKAYPELDVLLVGRGGGSYEDLWAFNEEIVARSIAASSIPVISCVGHEVDFTIADFVADLRAPTPSAAAELVVKTKAELIDRLYQLGRRLRSSVDHCVQRIEMRLENATSSRALTKPQEIFEERMQELDQIFQQMVNRENYLAECAQNRLNLLSTQTDLLSPLATLKRGYTICRDENLAIVTSSRQLRIGSPVTLGFASGVSQAVINALDHNGSITDGKKT
jgi:exodeoxyribonuclease VII large subunit